MGTTKKPKPRLRKPPLSIDEILAWADAHRRRTGQWPRSNSGRVLDAPRETWKAIDTALRDGTRGIPPRFAGRTLRQLLATHRGCQIPRTRRLTIRMILSWADAHHLQIGAWPRVCCRPIRGVPGETWSSVEGALRRGTRGLPGGDSLAKLLCRDRQVRSRGIAPPLTVDQILGWADAHHARTGDWPNTSSGRVDSQQETWANMSYALLIGTRGLPGGSSLSRLLAERRGRRAYRRALTIDQIISWADEHYSRTGYWPGAKSGPIMSAPRETWSKVDTALCSGLRGLPGGGSLVKLLAQKRGRRPYRPALTVDQILSWADALHSRTGRWPTAVSGTLVDAPGETWASISVTLRAGGRGLPGGSSLSSLLAEQRGHRPYRSALTTDQIVAWADAHLQRTGRLPIVKSGPIVDAPGEKWVNVDSTLRTGGRGLPGGSSLPRLLTERRGRRSYDRIVTVEQIISWADAHYRRTGAWPSPSSGPIVDVPRKKWSDVHAALRLGIRGLPGGDTLPRLLARFGRGHAKSQECPPI